MQKLLLAAILLALRSRVRQATRLGGPSGEHLGAAEPARRPPIPKFGWEGSGAYDPVRKTWIHQGGHDGIPQGFALFTYGVESGAWEQVFADNSPPGSCCVDGANVFDAANGRFVRFPRRGARPRMAVEPQGEDEVVAGLALRSRDPVVDEHEASAVQGARRSTPRRSRDR
jgi:hypothetical protein